MSRDALTIPEPVPASTSPPDLPGRTLVLYALLASSTFIVVGLIWDISWHMTIGRDTLWSPPHVLEQLGASLAGLSCGALVLRTTFLGTAADRGQTVSFWGFRGPLGAWVAIWGALAMIFSVPFDDWWHNAYGLDVEILSPPHMVLLAGMLGIQMGAMLLALGAQNRAAEPGRRTLAMAFCYAAGVLLTMAVIASFEHTGYANEWHGSRFYVITAGFVPFLLTGVAAAGRLRWPATVAAATYMGVMLGTGWVLQGVPATPRLSPILNAVDHMVPMPFPLVLVLPAVALDLVMRRGGGRSDWLLAPVLGLVFVATMVPVHWVFAEFLLSPAARNGIFLADRWPYNNLLGDWRYAFWNRDTVDGVWQAGLFLRRIGFAVLLATASARVGLFWGRWMARVQR